MKEEQSKGTAAVKDTIGAFTGMKPSGKPPKKEGKIMTMLIVRDMDGQGKDMEEQKRNDILSLLFMSCAPETLDHFANQYEHMLETYHEDKKVIGMMREIMDRQKNFLFILQQQIAEEEAMGHEGPIGLEFKGTLH